MASFIGEMNFLEGKVDKVYSDMIEVNVSKNRVFCSKTDMSIASGQDVLVCVRPEKIHINPSDKISNLIKSRINRIVFRGDDYEITTNFDNSQVRLVVGYTAWKKSRETGDDINIGWETQDSLVYPLTMKDDLINYDMQY